MGQDNSRHMFVHMLQIMLKDRGMQVTKMKLQTFLSFVEEVCPWFPQEGTMSLEIWKKIGKQIQTYYTLHGPNKVPVETFSLWSLIRDCLDFEHEEGSKLKHMLPPEEPIYATPKVYATPKGKGPTNFELESAKPLKENEGTLTPEDEESLEEQAAAYHKDDHWELLVTDNSNVQAAAAPPTKGLEALMQKLLITIKEEIKREGRDEGAGAISTAPPAYAPSTITGLDPPPISKPENLLNITRESHSLSPLQKAMQQAQRAGETVQGFSATFPVFEHENQRYYEALPFKQLKELKIACGQYGPTAPFTQTMIESLGGQNLPPSDWKQIARACLSGGDYLLWKSEFTEQCGHIAELNQRQGINTTYEMLVGEGAYQNTNAQLNYLPGAYAQISNAAQQAWKKLPCSSNKTEDLSKIRQGPDEPYQDFVARLLEAVGKIIADEQAGIVLTKQLAYENANSACQAALRPYRKKGGLSDYIRICADIGPSYMQGITLAAALQGKSIKEVLYQQQMKNKRGLPSRGNAGCFVCGQPGHRAAFCPQRANSGNIKTPNLCPRCKKGRHWAKDCKSKIDVQGNPLPSQSGNWVRGQPLAPKQCYGAMQGNQMVEGELQTCSEPPQGAQAWTSVPPPTQY
ncbi:endogenous retrovirus group K member 10 Gag polyprotein-like [Cervus elaphus]|uniref:endogenous retrovirus group K member 10 Gag polyprotein-like n=1 Tax=Cervus elaphus TaxID=9860 RepID=UPI001CC2F2FD|nr:endogenous retrovirus group K member 10 Gag polyprotein-like [Cervus elaphus]